MQAAVFRTLCRQSPDQPSLTQSGGRVREEDPIALLHSLIGDDGVEIQKLMGWGPTASPVESPLFAAIEAVAAKHHPGAAVSPAVLAAFTDSHFFRERGIAAYGYAPVMLPVEEAMRVHGNDGRLVYAPE